MSTEWSGPKPVNPSSTLMMYFSLRAENTR